MGSRDVRYGDDPWTTGFDGGFEEYSDLKADPYQQRNLAHYGEVPRETLDRLRGRLLELRGCKASGCRTAEDAAVP